MNAIQQVGILLAVALVWLLVNYKAATGWLKLVSIVALLTFMGLASWVAICVSGVL